MKIKNFVTYAKKNLILIKMIKMHLNIIRLEIIVMTQEHLEELLITFVI